LELSVEHFAPFQIVIKYSKWWKEESARNKIVVKWRK
jgi:hypothetical protein